MRRSSASASPPHEIVKLEEELDVDLVVMATHGRTGEKYEKLGSVAEQVVRESTRPVLTIRPRIVAARSPIS